MYFSFRIFLAFLISTFLFASCSEVEKTKSVEDSFVSFMSNSPSSIIYGKVVLKDFITNLHYQDLPKLNVLFAKEVETITKGFDLKEPIYYTVDSLLQQDGSPTGMYLFFKVKDKDSLANKLSTLGYLIEPTEEKLYVIGEHISGQIDKHLAVIHLSSYASKKSVLQAIEKCKSPINNQIKKNLSNSNALSVHIYLEHLQRLLDNQSLERPVSKRDELLALYKNSFITIDFKFQQEKFLGDIVFDFNPALKRRLFFDTKAAENVAQIAKNDFVSGLGISIKSMKADLFINDFYPSLISNLAGSNLSTQMAIMMLGDKPISNFTNGNLAFAYHDFGIPTCNIELGNKAKEIQKMSTPYLTYLNFGQLRFEGSNFLNTTLSKTNSLPNTTKNNTGFFFFYNSKNDSHIRKLDDDTKFLDAISSILFYLNNEGGKIEIHGKKQKEGLLHQIANMYLKEIQENIK
jgi:hypothetical protein